MPHTDVQIMIVFVIVAAAFWVIGRRMWGQILAFRSRPRRRKTSPSASRAAAPTSPAPLIQLQIKPPAHLKRPPPED